MESLSTTSFCPTYSRSVGGRSVTLKLSSSLEIRLGETRRSLIGLGCVGLVTAWPRPVREPHAGNGRKGVKEFPVERIEKAHELRRQVPAAHRAVNVIDRVKRHGVLSLVLA